VRNPHHSKGSIVLAVMLLLLSFAGAMLYLFNWLVDFRSKYGPAQQLQFVTTRTRHEDNPCSYGVAPRAYVPGTFLFIEPLDRRIGSGRPSRLVGCAEQKQLRVSERPLLFIHGYNNTFRDAANATTRLASDLKLSSRIILLSWSTTGSSDAYIADINAARYAGEEFDKLLEELVMAGVQPSIIAHSMGSQVVIEGIDRYAIRYAVSVPHPIVDELVLAAADLDINLLSQKLHSVRPWVRRITIYVTRNDVALKVSQLVGRSPRVGQPSAALLRVPGVDVVDVSLVEPQLFSGHHSYYQYNSRVLQDIFAVVHSGAPVHNRFGTIQRSANGVAYWQLRP
jgi:pimeloyl-ACP methyl ester carboxylesterase